MVAYDYDLDEDGKWRLVERLGRRYSKARKQYRCDSCPALILPGDHYIRDFVVSNRVPTTLKRHQTCPQQMQRSEP